MKWEEEERKDKRLLTCVEEKRRAESGVSEPRNEQRRGKENKETLASLFAEGEGRDSYPN